MFDVSSLNDKHDCNVVSISSMNINDANDMQSHKLGDAIFDEDDLFNPLLLMSKFTMMKTCLLFMMITMRMKVGLEECQL